MIIILLLLLDVCNIQECVLMTYKALWEGVFMGKEHFRRNSIVLKILQSCQEHNRMVLILFIEQNILHCLGYTYIQILHYDITSLRGQQNLSLGTLLLRKYQVHVNDFQITAYKSEYRKHIKIGISPGKTYLTLSTRELHYKKHFTIFAV